MERTPSRSRARLEISEKAHIGFDISQLECETIEQSREYRNCGGRLGRK